MENFDDTVYPMSLQQEEEEEGESKREGLGADRQIRFSAYPKDHSS